MKNILFITPKLNRAGAQIHVLELCRHLDKEKYSPRVCVLCEDKGILAEEFEKLGARVDNIGVGKISLLVESYKYFTGAEIDILHVHDAPFPAILVTIIARIKGVKAIIWHLHGLWWFSFCRKYIFKSLMKIINNLCTTFIAVSHYTREFWIKEFGLNPEKVVVIANGVDPAVFTPTPKVEQRPLLKLNVESKVIGTVGSLTPKKGHKYLIMAAKRVLETFHDVYFVIVGDGELRAQLDCLSSELRVRDKILFLGTRHDIPNILKEFDIFVFPSAYEKRQRIGETFGIAILEAMATAKPVVASRFSGIPEVVEDGETGILVKPADPEALAEIIINLLNDPNKAIAMGIAGRRLVEEKFLYQKTVSMIEAIYGSIM